MFFEETKTSIVLLVETYSSETSKTLFSMLAPDIPCGRENSTSFSVVSEGMNETRLEVKVVGVPCTTYRSERLEVDCKPVTLLTELT